MNEEQLKELYPESYNIEEEQEFINNIFTLEN